MGDDVNRLVAGDEVTEIGDKDITTMLLSPITHPLKCVV
jgi:hypothetical protein